MKLRVLLLGFTAVLASNFSAPEAQAVGRQRHNSRYAHYSGNTGTGHRYHVYAAYPKWYTGMVPISRFNSGAGYQSNNGLWIGAYPGAYVTGSSAYGGAIAYPR